MKILRDTSLTIVLVLATLATIIGMVIAGHSVYSNELSEHGRAPIAFSAYVTSGHFLSSLFENWESEFLQMSAYVVLTAFLFQRGSAESNDPDKASPQDASLEGNIKNPDAPSLVRRGGAAATFYAYSLGLALFTLFLASFLMHLRDSAAAQAEEAVMHGRVPPTAWEHLGSAQFWFESFQNWQSEFLSTAILVILSIFLRFRGSPESKPVAAPHTETGA